LEAKKEHSATNTRHTVEKSTAPMPHLNLRHIEEEIGGLLVDSYTGIDGYKGELRNVLGQS